MIQDNSSQNSMEQVMVVMKGRGKSREVDSTAIPSR